MPPFKTNPKNGYYGHGIWVSARRRGSCYPYWLLETLAFRGTGFAAHGSIYDS